MYLSTQHKLKCLSSLFYGQVSKAHTYAFNKQMQCKNRVLCVFYQETDPFIFHRISLNMTERQRGGCSGAIFLMSGFHSCVRIQSAQPSEKLRSAQWRLIRSLHHHCPQNLFALSILGTLYTAALISLFICHLATATVPAPVQGHWLEQDFPSSCISDSLHPFSTKH